MQVGAQSMTFELGVAGGEPVDTPAPHSGGSQSLPAAHGSFPGGATTTGTVSSRSAGCTPWLGVEARPGYGRAAEYTGGSRSPTTTGEQCTCLAG